MRENRTIKATLYITVVMNVLLFPYVQMVPIIARDILHVDAALMGVLQAAEGLGALVGAVLIASAVRLNYHGRVFLGGSLLALVGPLCLLHVTLVYPLSASVALARAGHGRVWGHAVHHRHVGSARGNAWESPGGAQPGYRYWPIWFAPHGGNSECDPPGVYHTHERLARYRVSGVYHGVDAVVY